MYCYPKYTHVAIFCNKTLDYQRAYLLFNGYYCIDAFVFPSGSESNNLFNNIPKYTLDNYIKTHKNKATKIIITTKQNEDYEHDFTLLESYNLEFLEDFIFSFMLYESNQIDSLILAKLCKTKEKFEKAIHILSHGRRTYMINGNCQTDFFKNYLLANKEWVTKFYYIDIPRIQLYKEEDKYALDCTLAVCDVCLSQIINKTNKFTQDLVTENIFNNLKTGAQKVIISNITFMGYYPQYGGTEQKNSIRFG